MMRSFPRRRRCARGAARRRAHARARGDQGRDSLELAAFAREQLDLERDAQRELGRSAGLRRRRGRLHGEARGEFHRALNRPIANMTDVLMTDAFICDAIRTPIGRYGGALSSVRPDDLAAVVLRELLRRNEGLDPKAVDDVIMGCANQAGEDNRNVARMSALLAGLPVDVPGATLNRLCGSGSMRWRARLARFAAARAKCCSPAASRA
jgi:hypothetical protein